MLLTWNRSWCRWFKVYERYLQLLIRVFKLIARFIKNFAHHWTSPIIEFSSACSLSSKPASLSPTCVTCLAIDCAADLHSSHSFVNFCSSYLKACFSFGTCALLLMMLTGTLAQLFYASVVESNFLLLSQCWPWMFYLLLPCGIPHGTSARKKLWG